MREGEGGGEVSEGSLSISMNEGGREGKRGGWDIELRLCSVSPNV